MRRAAVFVACVVAVAALPAFAQEITGARFAEPTTRYPHGALGDTTEYGALILETRQGPDLRIVLPITRVFEDTAPRLVDLDGDGTNEVIAVESHTDRGSRLAVLDERGLVAVSGWIGQRFRWLAPVGAADLDGDGGMEIAYVDRPHLAKVLRVVRMEGGSLVEVASLEGMTNHRNGEAEIQGGIRDCGEGPEMVVASADWSQVLAVSFDGAVLTPRELGPMEDPESMTRALACE